MNKTIEERLERLERLSKKKYYNSVLVFTLPELKDAESFPRAKQLVLATSVNAAKSAVKKAALEEYPEIIIMELRIDEVIIGE